MRKIFIGLLFLTLSVTVVAQQRNLTDVLNSLSEERGVVFSFSPTLTDKTNTKPVDFSGSVGEILKRLLADTCFDYRQLGQGNYYRIFKRDKPVVVPVSSSQQAQKDQQPRIRPKVATVEQLQPAPPLQPLDIYEWKPTSPLPAVARYTPVTIKQTHTLRKNSFLPLPVLAIKTNLLYDATVTINLGVEIGLGLTSTLDISGNYNNWTYSDNHKMKHWLIQPEFRLWTCTRFSGGFWGFHAHFAEFNWGGMLPWGFKTGKMFGTIENAQIMNHRYQGWLVGAGISYGYHFILSPRWSIEATLGAGYAYLKYNKYKCEKCGEILGNESRHYVGPTKAGISLIYMIK